jgi:hypothetical protein
MDRKRSRTKGGSEQGILFPRSSDPSPEERERRLREGVIVAIEPILAGTRYWGRAEAEAANAIAAEKDPKRRKEMRKRYEELALRLKDRSRKERGQLLFDEIAKWQKQAQGRPERC